LIYFLLTDLSKIHSFYKFSLESFIVVINRAIDLISNLGVAEDRMLTENKPEEKKEEVKQEVKEEKKEEIKMEEQKDPNQINLQEGEEQP